MRVRATHLIGRWVVAGALLLAATAGGGCGGEAAGRDPDDAAAGGGNRATGARATGADQTGVRGTGSPPTGDGGRASGSFTVEFARCMREHGVPNFPDPTGAAGQLGPGSGVDPTSDAFQSALNGPCEPLAPTAWLDGSGPGTAAGNG